MAEPEVKRRSSQATGHTLFFCRFTASEEEEEEQEATCFSSFSFQICVSFLAGRIPGFRLTVQTQTGLHNNRPGVQFSGSRLAVQAEVLGQGSRPEPAFEGSPQQSFELRGET